MTIRLVADNRVNKKIFDFFINRPCCICKTLVREVLLHRLGFCSRRCAHEAQMIVCADHGLPIPEIQPKKIY